MPLYTYRCKKCGKEVEALVIGNRGEPKKCEKCGSSKLERRFGTFSCGKNSSASSTGAASSSCTSSSCAPT